MPEHRAGRALVLSGALFALLALPWIGGCCCEPAVDTVCGECDETGVIVSGLGGASAPPPAGFAGPDELIEFLSTGYNTPPPLDREGDDVVLVKVLINGASVNLDARGIPGAVFRSRPAVRDRPPPFWLVVMTSADRPVYWRTADDPRTVRSEKPGITTSRSLSGGPAQVATGLATLRVPFQPFGKIRLYEAIPPGAAPKPFLAEFEFASDVPLRFAILGGLP